MLTETVLEFLIDSLLSLPHPVSPMAKQALVQLSAMAYKMGPQEASKDVESITRTVYLTFEDTSKTVGMSAKPPSVGGTGKVSIQVSVNIPLSLFTSPQLKAQVNLPPGGVSQDVIVDLENALSMSYGKKIQLIVEPTETV